MAEGGVFIKVKRTDLEAAQGADLYVTKDISAEIIDHLCFKYGYNRDGARDLVEFYWQDEQDTKFMEQVKKEYLEAGFAGKDYIAD